MKMSRAAAATALFVVLLALIYWAHITYLKVDVVFYSALGDGALAAVISGAVLFGAPFFCLLNRFERAQLVVIWLLAGYGFAISVPTVIDRSLSFYILEKLQQRGGGIRMDAFEYVFTTEYVREHRLVDVRLTEQQESGTVVIRDGCVKLTAKGDKLASFSRMFRRNFLPRERLLMGGYSDDLTDPFRASIEQPQYVCK